MIILENPMSLAIIISIILFMYSYLICFINNKIIESKYGSIIGYKKPSVLVSLVTPFFIMYYYFDNILPKIMKYGQNFVELNVLFIILAIWCLLAMFLLIFICSSNVIVIEDKILFIIFFKKFKEISMNDIKYVTNGQQGTILLIMKDNSSKPIPIKYKNKKVVEKINSLLK